MNEIHFANPNLLWLIFIVVPMIAYYIYRTIQGGATIQISSIKGVSEISHTYKYYLRHLPFIIRICAITLLIIAIARPQSRESGSSSTTEGIDIVMAIDVSTSMLARDFEPDRLSAAKDVASRFIVDRKSDRMGLVIFASESFTQSPLTTDKGSLQNLMAQIQCGVLDDGTAIGNGLATSINRLKESTAKSKIIILLTDGVNNSGTVMPPTAADIAKSFGIKVYTIGVGSEGTAPYPAQDMWGNISYVQMKVEIDEDMLRKIAKDTGGEYFRATDKDALIDVYETINQLERTEIETNDFVNYIELYVTFVLIGLALLIIEQLLNYLVFRSIP